MSVREVTLGEVAEFVNGVAFKEGDWGDSGRKIIRIQNLNDPEKPFNRTLRDVADKNLARSGDLLVSWAASLGVYEWGGDESCINQHIFKVIPDSNVVDKNYLRRVLEASISKMEREAHGATMKHITRGRFLDIRIPLPEVVEQRRVAAILDKVDALRVKRREAIAKLDLFLHSVFHEFFGDPMKPPRGWATGVLGDVADLINGDRGENYPSREEFVECGIPFFNAGHLGSNGAIDFTAMNYIDRKCFERLGSGKTRAGDILYCLRGSLGKMAIVDYSGDAAVASSLVILRPKACVQTDFLYYFLRTPFCVSEMRAYDNGSSQPNLSAASLKKFRIVVPPLDLQSQFAMVVARVRRSYASAVASRDELEGLFNSLQKSLFSGAL